MDRHPAEVVGQLLEGAWTASALARVIARGIDEPLPAADPAVALLSRAGLLEADGAAFVLRGREHLRGREAMVLASIRSGLGQAYDIARAPRVGRSRATRYWWPRAWRPQRAAVASPR
jgi:hypothetical protein